MTMLVVGAVLVGMAAAVVVWGLLMWLGQGREAPAVPPVPPATLGGDANAEVQALLAQGRKIEAIKHVRALSGLGLKEAKDYVEALERGGVPSPPLAGVMAEGPATDPVELEREVWALLAQGRKIEAIKRARELTGLGLKEAKDYVEALEREEPPPLLPDDDLPAQPPDAGQLEHEARGLLAGGQKLEAIKRVRELTGWGLKEAKDYVEQL